MEDDNVGEVILWGEHETPASSSQLHKEIFNNMEYEVILSSIKNTKFKKSFFNSDMETNFTPLKKEMEFLKLDNSMKDVIKLVKYKEDVKETVERGKLKRNIVEIDNQLRLLQVPKLLHSESKINKQVVLKVDSNFANGMWTERPLSVTPQSALNILSTSVATVLTFTGFTETTIIPLHVLTEVAEAYILKLLRLLHINVEKENVHGESGFCDVLDRTFHEAGVGSLRNLIKYYQNSITKAKDMAIKECKQELCVCEDTMENLREEIRQLNSQNITILKDDGFSIPELHVTSIVGNDLLAESFENDLQMLQSLERHQIKSPSEED